MVDAHRTNRGFVVYAKIPCREGELRVQESSIAFNGAHVWLFLDGAPCRTHLGEHYKPNPQLSVGAAKKLIVALSEFVRQAENDELLEPETVENEGW